MSDRLDEIERRAAAYSALRDAWLSGQISPAQMQQHLDDDPEFEAWMREQASNTPAPSRRQVKADIEGSTQ